MHNQTDSVGNILHRGVTRVALCSPDVKLASHPGSRNLVLASPKERARNDEPSCLTEDDDAKPMGVEIQAAGEECEQSDRSEDATVNAQARCQFPAAPGRS